MEFAVSSQKVTRGKGAKNKILLTFPFRVTFQRALSNFLFWDCRARGVAGECDGGLCLAAEVGEDSR